MLVCVSTLGFTLIYAEQSGEPGLKCTRTHGHSHIRYRSQVDAAAAQQQRSASRRGQHCSSTHCGAISQRTTNSNSAAAAQQQPWPKRRPPRAEDELATKILRQVEYYFSDDSYPFDDYIKSQETNGWTPLATIAAFKKMVSYTTDLDVIRSALKASDAMDLDEKGDNLKGATSRPTRTRTKKNSARVGFWRRRRQGCCGADHREGPGTLRGAWRIRALRNLSQDGSLLDGSAFVRFAKSRGRSKCGGDVGLRHWWKEDRPHVELWTGSRAWRRSARP